MELKDDYTKKRGGAINGIITTGAIALINGMSDVEVERLQFHDAEVVSLTVNYPEEGDFFMDVDMRFLWGRYSRIQWRFIGLIVFELRDDGADRYLYDADIFVDREFLAVDFGSFGSLECLRAEIMNIEEFPGGISPAEQQCKEHYEQGKPGLPCVSMKRIQST